MAYTDGLSRPVLARYKLPGFVLVAAGMVVSVGATVCVRELTRPVRYELRLAAQHRANATYFSAFEEGPVFLDHDGSDGRTVTLRRNFTWAEDGCEWQAVERLEPEGHGYRYYYVEHFVSCPEGLEPHGITSPLEGVVTATRVREDRTLTPLVAHMQQPIAIE